MSQKMIEKVAYELLIYQISDKVMSMQKTTEMLLNELKNAKREKRKRYESIKT